MYAALPHSDYYGGSVAVPNIQCHLSWQNLEIYHHKGITHSHANMLAFCSAFRVRQSPFSNVINSKLSKDSHDDCRIAFSSFFSIQSWVAQKLAHIFSTNKLWLCNTAIAVFRRSSYINLSDCASGSIAFILISSPWPSVKFFIFPFSRELTTAQLMSLPECYFPLWDFSLR